MFGMGTGVASSLKSPPQTDFGWRISDVGFWSIRHIFSDFRLLISITE